MELNDVQRALITRALDRLAQGDDYAHEIGLIERIAGKEVANEVRALQAEYNNANGAAKKSGGAMLSAEAADYWQEAQGTLAYGGMVKANPARGRGIALSRKCETLSETFDARVPDQEKGKFRQYIDGDASNWDDRWHNTEDYFFPLLDAQFAASVPVKNPMAEAQRTVLAGLLDQPALPSAANVSRLSELLRSLAEERSAVVAKAQKEARKKVLAERRKAKIDAGDQQATKDIRAKKLKVIPGVIGTGGDK